MESSTNDRSRFEPEPEGVVVGNTKDNFINDDENVKAMRETAAQLGITQLLREIRDSEAAMGMEDIDRLLTVLELLGEGQVTTTPLTLGRRLHLDVSPNEFGGDPVVSLWDTPTSAINAAEAQGGRYIALQLTPEQEALLQG
jgi:hypothetical protein